MILFRLETRNTEFTGEVGEGVYRAYSRTRGSQLGGILDGSRDELVPYNEYVEAHPTPRLDPKLSRYHILGNHVFCFETEEALRRWFTCIDGAKQIILDLVQISVYQVPDGKYILGTFQAVAEADYMRRVDTWRPERRK